MQTLNAIRLAQQLLLPKLASARCIVDATAGNGKDTVFLAKNGPKDGMIYAFDIQESALEAAKQRLVEEQLDHKVQLILDSHANVKSYVDGLIDVAMFNLGYLPGKCHQTMTMPHSTISALTVIISQLAVGGMISVVGYPGHETGKEENDAVRKYTMGLPADQFTVMCSAMINHSKQPPILYVIEKIRGIAE